VQIFGDNADGEADDCFGIYSIDPDHVGDLKPDAKITIKNVGAYVEWMMNLFGGELDTNYHHVK